MPKQKQSAADRLPVPVELIARRIYRIRGEKVMIDSDLAELYRVPTFRLNEAVKRNLGRFPADFMFQLTKQEAGALTSQNAMSKGRGGRRTFPYAFTECRVHNPVNAKRRHECLSIPIHTIRFVPGAYYTLLSIFALT